MKKNAASLVVILAAVTILCFGSPASGHSVGQFYGDLWSDRSVEYYFSDDDPWPTAWKDRATAADSRWVHSNFSFVAMPDASVGWTSCALPVAGERKSIVSKGDLASDVGGQTEKCYLANTPERFHLVVNTADFSWYQGTGDDGNNNTLSAVGIFTHEFGHATGWGGGTDGDDHLTGSYCPNGDLASYHTMCLSPPDDYDEAWRWYSLETHDVHTFEAAY